MTKKVLAVTLVAAVASVAVYAYIQKKETEKAQDITCQFYLKVS